MAVYLYGVVPAETSGIDAKGLEDQPVRLVVHEDVAALVSDAGDEELLGRRRELLRHAEVIEHAMATAPVLPLQFGVVADSDEAVAAEVLEPHHDELVRLMDEVRGRVEVRVRGFYDEEQVITEIVSSDATLQGGGASMSDRIRLGERVAAHLDELRRQDAQLVTDTLRPHAIDVIEQPPTTAMMAVSTAFLVAEDDLDAFDEAVRALGDDVPDRLRLRYVGPVPPASFFDLTLLG